MPDPVAEAKRALWLKLQPGYDMTLINDLVAVVRARPPSDAEVEAAAKALIANRRASHETQARAALRAAREAVEAGS